MAKKITLYYAEAAIYSDLTASEEDAWGSLSNAISESRVKDTENKMHEYQCELIETYKKVDIYKTLETGDFAYAADIEGGGWFIEYDSLENAKKDIDLNAPPNPEMLTDLWQGKWWF